jgi:hypothetical protein
MHRPSVVKTPTVKTASIMLPSTESGLPLDGRRPKYSQSLAVQMAIITVDQKFVRALPLSHSSVLSLSDWGRSFFLNPWVGASHQFDNLTGTV